MATAQKRFGYEDLSWQDKLAFFQTNPEAAQHDIQRAQNKANLQKATGDTKGYDASMHWINQINTVTGQKPVEQQARERQMNPYQGDVSSLVERLREFNNRPQQQFSYNPQTDPQYQAALNRANVNAQQGSNATMAEMNRRGILNSTVTSDRSEEIRQNELGRVEDTIVPQLRNQAYNEFQNRQAQEQQEYANLQNMIATLSGLNQQAFGNTFALDQFNRGITESDRNYGLQQDAARLNETQVMAQLTGFMPDGTPTNAQQQQQLMNEWQVAEQTGYITPTLAQLYGLPAGMQTRAAKQHAESMAIQRMNASTSRMNANTSANNAAINQAMELWRVTGVAPQGIPGVEPGSPYPQQSSASGPSINDLVSVWRSSGSAPTGLEDLGVSPGTPYHDPTANRSQSETTRIDPKDSTDNYFNAIDYIEEDNLSKADALQYAEVIRDYLTDSDYKSFVKYIQDNF